LPGEEAIYQNIQSVLEAAKSDPKLHAALVASADHAEENLITPLFQFHNWGIPLPHNWTTQNNGAKFGTDYLRVSPSPSRTFSSTHQMKRSIFIRISTTMVGS